MTTLRDLLTLNWHIVELDIILRTVDSRLVERVIITPDAKELDKYANKTYKPVDYVETYTQAFINYGDDSHVKNGVPDMGIGTIWKNIPKQYLDKEVTYFEMTPKPYYYKKDDDGEYVFVNRDSADFWYNCQLWLKGGLV